MLKKGMRVFVQIPNEYNQRTLKPGQIVESRGTDRYAAEFEEDLPLETGMDVLLWYEHQRDFLQHCARIEEQQRRPKLRVAFEILGDPITGERRRHFRVSTAGAGVTAHLEGEAGCSVLDVSASGLSVVARASHPVGVTLPAALQFQGEEFEGRVCVQNTREWGRGVFRYGLRAIQVRGRTSDLLLSLTQVSLAVQSRQLAGPS